MSLESPEGFEITFEEPNYLPNDPKKVLTDISESPKEANDQMNIYSLASWLGTIVCSKDKYKLFGQHIMNPISSDVENFLKKVNNGCNLDFLVLSGINYTNADFNQHGYIEGLTDYSAEEILSKSPKDIFEDVNDLNQDLTYLEEFIIKRGQAETVCQDQGVKYFPYWSEKSDHTTSMGLSIPGEEIAVSHYKRNF
jgi:hypothetical protein